jgi:hypothetical protein
MVKDQLRATLDIAVEAVTADNPAALREALINSKVCCSNCSALTAKAAALGLAAAPEAGWTASGKLAEVAVSAPLFDEACHESGAGGWLSDGSATAGQVKPTDKAAVAARVANLRISGPF